MDAAIKAKLMSIAQNPEPFDFHNHVRIVDVDDAFCATAEFACGAIGTLEASRFATGNKNGLRFEIDGEKGAISFDLMKLNELQYYDATAPRALQGWRTIQVTEEGVHPYAGLRWPVGHQLGWADSVANEFYAFYSAILNGTHSTPDFGDALRIARVIDAWGLKSESEVPLIKPASTQ